MKNCVKKILGVFGAIAFCCANAQYPIDEGAVPYGSTRRSLTASVADFQFSGATKQLLTGVTASASFPAYSFPGVGNNDNGLWRSGTDQISLVTAGVNRITIGPTGSISFGTATSLSPTEFSYLSGLTANVQAQINALDTIDPNAFVLKAGDSMGGKLINPFGFIGPVTGLVNGSVTLTGVTANRVLVSNSLQGITSSGVLDTELAFLSGTTANIQTQINNFAAGAGFVLKIGDTMSGHLNAPEIRIGDGDATSLGPFRLKKSQNSSLAGSVENPNTGSSAQTQFSLVNDSSTLSILNYSGASSASNVPGMSVNNVKGLRLNGSNGPVSLATGAIAVLTVTTGQLVNIPNLTSSRALVTDASNNLAVSSTLASEIAFLSGTTQSIVALLGGVTSNLSPLNGVTGTVLGQYLNGLTNNVQTQINSNTAFVRRAGDTMTGPLVMNSVPILFTSSAGYIGQNTSDGSDNRRMAIAGGGDGSAFRGAAVFVYGNQSSVNPGGVEVSLGTSGEVPGAYFGVTGSALHFKVDQSGNLTENGNITSTATMTGGTVIDITQNSGKYLIAGNTMISVGTGYGAGNLFLGTTDSTVTSGTNNVAIGSGAGDAITSGFTNVAVGQNAGSGITSGAANTLVGRSSGSALTTATDNTFVGNGTMPLATTSSKNTVVGASAAPAISVGAANRSIFVGANAGVSVTAATDLVLIGVSARTNSTATSAIAIGTNAVAAASSAVQIGEGTNSTPNSIQFDGWNFLDSSGNGTFAALNGATTVTAALLNGLTANVQTQLNNKLNALNTSVSQMGNSAATETDLFSYTVPANTLNSDGKGVYIKCGGTFAGTVSTDKRIRAKLGSTTLFDTGTIAVTAANSWRIEGDVIRSGATSEKTGFELNTSFASFSAYASYSSAAEDLTTGLALKITGQGTNANDVVLEYCKVRLEP